MSSAQPKPSEQTFGEKNDMDIKQYSCSRCGAYLGVGVPEARCPSCGAIISGEKQAPIPVAPLVALGVMGLLLVVIYLIFGWIGIGIAIGIPAALSVVAGIIFFFIDICH